MAERFHLSPQKSMPRRRKSETSKHQAPSSRNIPSSKLQTTARDLDRRLKFLWRLALGIWSFKSNLRSGRALENDADHAGHVVLVYRIGLQLFPDRRGAKRRPVLFVLVRIFAARHVSQAGHVRANRSAAIKNRGQPDLFHHRRSEEHTSELQS